MILLATSGGFVVTDKTKFDDFHIEPGELSHDKFTAVASESADVTAHDEPRHLWVSVEFLHRELATATHPERRTGLEKMLAYAASKGWVNDAGTHVAAHIVVPQSE